MLIKFLVERYFIIYDEHNNHEWAYDTLLYEISRMNLQGWDKKDAEHVLDSLKRIFK